MNDNYLLHYYPLNKLIGNQKQYLRDFINGYNAYLGILPLDTTNDPQISMN